MFQKLYLLAERYYGMFKSGNLRKHGQDVERITGMFTILPIFNSLERYGREKTRLEAAGTRIPDLDLLTGTSALHHDMVLVSNNIKHMARLQNVRLENWTTVADNQFIS